MKYLAKLTALLAVIIMALFLTAPLPGSASTAGGDGSPTNSAILKRQRECYKNYNSHGSGRGTDGKFTSKMAKQYQKDKCDESKGGNCTLDSSSQGLIAHCSNPDEQTDDGDTGSTGGGASGDNITDPAISQGAECTTDNCDFITNYINPFITLMTVLVGIAVAAGIIIGAIQVITSAGDPQKNANGKNHIRNALIALVAYIILFAFLQWIIPGGLQT